MAKKHWLGLGLGWVRAWIKISIRHTENMDHYHTNSICCIFLSNHIPHEDCFIQRSCG